MTERACPRCKRPLPSPAPAVCEGCALPLCEGEGDRGVEELRVREPQPKAFRAEPLPGGGIRIEHRFAPYAWLFVVLRLIVALATMPPLWWLLEHHKGFPFFVAWFLGALVLIALVPTGGSAPRLEATAEHLEVFSGLVLNRQRLEIPRWDLAQLFVVPKGETRGVLTARLQNGVRVGLCEHDREALLFMESLLERHLKLDDEKVEGEAARRLPLPSAGPGFILTRCGACGVRLGARADARQIACPACGVKQRPARLKQKTGTPERLDAEVLRLKVWPRPGRTALWTVGALSGAVLLAWMAEPVPAAIAAVAAVALLGKGAFTLAVARFGSKLSVQDRALTRRTLTGTETFAEGTVTQLYVESADPDRRERGVSMYAVTSDGRQVRLGETDSVREALAVEATLEQRLGIEDRLVAGEVTEPGQPNR